MITLIFCGDLRYCPYLKRYTERLNALEEPFEVLFWNRGGFSLNLSNEYYYYDSPSDESLGKIQKIKDFIGFRKWIKNHLRSHPTDGLVLLSTLTGMLLISELKQYSKKYIFDIRDYSYENLCLFRKLEKKIIDNSFFTAISSKGFKAFLPQHKYIIAHNFNRNEMINNPRFHSSGEQIQLVWNGTVRFFDFQKKYIDALKNDPRFFMVYHGAGTDLERYRDYCEKNKIENVAFTGPYDNKDKEKLLSNADILNNCYGGRSGDELRYAVSNRYYDGLLYHIPQLVEPDGYKASLVQQNGIGIALEATDSFADQLYAYYMGIKDVDFDHACENQMSQILNEDNEFINAIDNFIESMV